VNLPFGRPKKPINDLIRAVEGNLDPVVSGIQSLGYTTVAACVKEARSSGKGAAVTLTIALTGIKE
jgi:hypothetical protein